MEDYFIISDQELILKDTSLFSEKLEISNILFILLHILYR